MADMLKGGVIMDVVTPEQAKIAEDAGAVAVMALERVPADIRAQGGVARMSDPDMIDQIIGAVSIPVMAKCRIGHFAEAQVLQAIGVDYIDESEVLTPADEAHHVDKWAFTVPFVCGATNLGEALRRIAEGAAMIRSKGEAGTGNVVEATRHMRQIAGDIRRLGALRDEELFAAAKELQAPYELVAEVAGAGKLPVVLFTAGGIATPADAALMMQLGAEGVFVGLGHLQVRRPGPPCRRHRQGHHLPRRPRCGRQGVARPRRGHGRHQHRHPRTGRALCGARLVKHPAAPAGVSARAGPSPHSHPRESGDVRTVHRPGAPGRRPGPGGSPELGHGYIGTEHILLGLLAEGEGMAAQVLADARDQPGRGAGAGRGDRRGGHRQPGHIPFTPRTKKVLELSLREAQRLGDSYIGTEHILLGLIREGEGVGAQVLVRLGASTDRVLAQVLMTKRAARGARNSGGSRATANGRPGASGDHRPAATRC